MKTFIGFLIGIFLMVFGVISLKGQNVFIEVPESNIFNRSEYISPSTTVMNTNRSNWDYGAFGLGPTDPTFTSTSGPSFNHTTSSFSLPNSVLKWQLDTMGGRQPATGFQGNLPGFQFFKTTATKWFEPPTSYLGGGFNPGNINFIFKITADQFATNTFNAGNYSMSISQNYNFTPRTFQTIITIPATITWLTNTPTKFIEISSLNDYRNVSGQITSDLGNIELGNTVDFNLWAKASSANIQFVSSKGASGTRNISNIKLGSAGPELTTKPLTNTSEKFSPTTFGVKTGNRNNFIPQLSISAADFKTNFFEAGTYTFQLNFDAKSTDNSISRLQNTDVTLKVLPLSEITIPNTGQTVNFNFNTSSQYAKGQSQVVQKQLKLSNNESFELYVKSDENYFKKGGVQTPINSNILQIGINGSALMPLSTTAKQIISGGNPVLDKELDIKYEIPSAGAQTLVGYDKATYTINVIYSFIAL